MTGLGADTLDTTLFFCIGAPRAGTSWLYRHLSQHPGCHLRGVKELHYFDTLERGNFNWQLRFLRRRRAQLAGSLEQARPGAFWERKLSATIAEYEDLTTVLEHPDADHSGYLSFLSKGRGEAGLIGDITPAYATLSEASLRVMAGLTRRVRFLYLLRDPLTRLWSNIRQSAAGWAGRHGGGVAERTEALIEAYLGGEERELEQRCDYAGTLTRLERAVAPGARLVLFYETLFSEDTIRRLMTFLGLSYAAPEFAHRVHAAAPAEMSPAQAARMRARLAPQYAFVRERFGAAVPPRWDAPMTEVR